MSRVGSDMTVRSTRRRLRRLAVAALSAASLAAATLSPHDVASAAPASKVGVECTPGVGDVADRPIFNLSTKTGYINLPDGNTAFMWGFSSGFDAFQHPGPVLCVNQNDKVTVILHNDTPLIADPVSIVFPGQSDVLADGAPSQHETAGGRITSLTRSAAAGGGAVSYTFTAGSPGTYLYESGTNPEKQVRMGLFGALIVRPTLGADYANANSNSRFTKVIATQQGVTASEEFMVMLSEIDPYQHQAVEQNKTFNLNNYKPRYWLINGRGFPDSIADNHASWLPSQPYGALAQVTEFDGSNHPLPGLGRYLNVGTEDYPFHPHGNNGLVIGRDGRALEGADGEDLSFEKYAINIGPGQTWDVLFKWYDAEHYNSTTRKVPVPEPDLQTSVIGTFYSGSPYLGTRNNLPPGTQSLNQCGEFYIISHNHALFQITSWGANMTGPITYMRIDPPNKPANCG